MKEKVLYVGLQPGDSKLGIPDLHLVEGESGSSRVFDEEKQTIVGVTDTAKKRGITIPKKFLIPFIALLILMGSALAYAEEKGCGYYVWHDHHKHNYTKKHKHEVCDSLSDHYRLDEPLHLDYFHGKTTTVTEGRDS